jgi:DNA-binding XRE family transcriptional regulator
MSKKKTETKNRFDGILEDVKDWKAGKTKWRTTLVEKDGTRTIIEESFPEGQERLRRSKVLKGCRGELDLSQREMATLLRAPARTYQGWEAGRPIPDLALEWAELHCQFKRGGIKALQGIRETLLGQVAAAKVRRRHIPEEDHQPA